MQATVVGTRVKGAISDTVMMNPCSAASCSSGSLIIERFGHKNSGTWSSESRTPTARAAACKTACVKNETW
jgi:hypothetical protein